MSRPGEIQAEQARNALEYIKQIRRDGASSEVVNAAIDVYALLTTMPIVRVEQLTRPS